MLRKVTRAIGGALIASGFIWLLMVASADDFETDVMVFGPVLPLMVKAAAGLVVMLAGLVIMRGGCANE